MASEASNLLIECTESGQVAIPTCLFGSCNASVVPICVCPEGYTNDRLTGRYNNCALPTWVPWAGGALSLFITSVGFLYGFFVAQFRSVHKTLAWRVAITASLSALMFFGASLSLHASGNMEMPVYGALLNNLGTGLTAYCIGIMVVISLAPVDRFSKSKYGLKFFRRFMLIGLPLYLFIGTTACTITGYALNDNRAISDAMGGVYAILAFGAAVACPIMFFHMRNFIKVLDAAIKLNSEQRVPYSTDEDSASAGRSPESPNMRNGAARMNRAPSVAEPNKSAITRDKISELRGKVMALMITATLSSALVSMVCVLCATLQFVTHTVPLSWVVYYAITIGIGLFSCQLAHSAKKDKESSSVAINRRSKQADAVGVMSDSALASTPE